MIINNKTIATALLLAVVPLSAKAQEAKQINALLLTGGGYHDYEKQKTILSEGISERINVKWTIVHKDANASKELLQEKGWSDGFDVVVYNICFADEKDGAFVQALTETHGAGLPAVMIHCTLHSYHWKTDNDAWVRLLGVTSMRHGKQSPITVTTVAGDHPVMKSLPKEWKTPNGELYHIDKVWDGVTVLADGSIDDGKSKHAVAWVNQFDKARIFGTSIGHHNETMQSGDFLDLVSKGLLWATGHLNEDGTAAAGYAVKN
jgi:type 1 glutamine amidotransferase